MTGTMGLNRVVETTGVPDLALWGKRAGLSEPYPLLCHLLDTAASAGVLWDRWLRPGLRDLLAAALAPGDPGLARRRVQAVAGLHDVGKASPWQGQVGARQQPGWAAGFRAELEGVGYGFPVPHYWQVSRHEAVALRALHGAPIPGDLDPRGAYAAVVAGGHHGTFHDLTTVNRFVPRELAAACSGRWAEQQHAHRVAVLDAVGLDARDEGGPLVGPGAAAALVCLAGLVVLADWLASEDASVVAGRGLLATGGGVVAPGAWVVAREPWFVRRLPQTVGVYTDIEDPVTAILAEHAGSPSALQRAAQDTGGGLLLATYPTGDGKTEAALLRHAAVTGEGLLFALPTRSTASAMMRRVRGAYAATPNAARLAHGFAALDPFYAPPRATIDSDGAGVHVDDRCGDDRARGLHPQAWLNGAKRSLLAPVTVSTCDQVLASALRQAHSPLRLLAVANRHVVLDEVHTYDQYQTRLLTELLAWWGQTGTRVTLLSATLPTWQRNQLVAAYAPGTSPLEAAAAAFPSHTVIAPDAAGTPTPVAGTARRSYTLGLEPVTSADPVDHHVQWARAVRGAHPHARVGVIVNTVGRAQQVAGALRDLGHTVLVLHSRLTAGHREQVSQQLQDLIGTSGTATGLTVVGTQVIEASLDIDVDFLSTDLAPAPGLVQRAGRLWRRADPARATRLGAATAGPVLTVHASVDEGGDLTRGGQMPYLLPEQVKTWRAVRGMSALVVPGGVQQFVDACAYSWDDVQAEAATWDSWADDALKRTARAGEVAVPLRGAGGYFEDPTYGHLVAMTNRSEVADTETRYVDRPSATYLLIDPDGTTPYAWASTLTHLATTRRPGDLRAALAATVPANGALHRVLADAHARTCATSTWDPAAPLLAGVSPVDLRLAPELVYDDDLGLSLVDT